MAATAAADDSRRRDVLETVYRAFNDRDAESALVHMAPDVDWPDVAAGGWLSGREAVRADWRKQWAESDPRVEPMRIEFPGDGKAHVRVDQLTRDRAGRIVVNGQVEHVYEFDGPFIKRMTIVEAAPEADDDEDEE
jgi:hypothetical protein